MEIKVGLSSQILAEPIRFLKANKLVIYSPNILYMMETHRDSTHTHFASTSRNRKLSKPKVARPLGTISRCCPTHMRGKET